MFSLFNAMYAEKIREHYATINMPVYNFVFDSNVIFVVLDIKKKYFSNLQ